MIKIYCDGASRGNPGPSSYGFIYLHTNGTLVCQSGHIGYTTNQEAEYRAILSGLNYVFNQYTLASNKLINVDVFSDSQNIVRQLNGINICKAPHLQPIYEEIKRYEYYYRIKYTYIPRDSHPLNTLADRLCNVALDAYERKDK